MEFSKISVNTKVDFSRKTIEMETVNDLAETIHKEVLNLKENSVKQALIPLGWTPPTADENTCSGCEHEGIQVNPYSPCANCIRWGGIEDAYTPKTGETK